VKSVKRLAKHTMKRRRLIQAGTALAVVIVLLIVSAGLYIQSLLNLVGDESFTGNPSIAESDLVDPIETDPQSTQTTPTIRPTLTPGPTSISGPTPEPTPIPVDPAVLAAEAALEAAMDAIAVRKDKQVTQILLIGTDNRGNEINGRSDTMIILSINRRTKQISLVSLMRALYVRIPGRGYSMLNAAFSWGGPKLLLQTVNDNFRLQIDDYMICDFSGFEQAIDAAGGVKITLTEAELDYLLQLHPDSSLVTGENTLDGAVALEYARIRKLDSDFARTGRQRQVIASLLHDCTGRSALELDGLARQILPLIKTNMSGTRLIGLAVDGTTYHSWPIKQLMLPVKNSHEMAVIRGAQMELFDPQINIEALHAFIYN
jgi:LCP family protein required for cell wall assembly